MKKVMTMKMIDTVRIKIPKQGFKITKPNVFHPSSDGLNQPIPLGRKPFYQCHFNPEKKDTLTHGYLPKLTVRKVLQGSEPEISLFIEFSVTKLLFDNNLYEVNEKNFFQVADVLTQKLNDIGVKVDPKVLNTAEVSRIDYSKNIIFDDGTIPYVVFKELSRCDLSSWYDRSYKNYRNGGSEIKWHTKTNEFIVYDKKKNLEGDPYVSRKLKSRLKNQKPFEIIRLEARLNNKAAIRNKFNSLGIDISDFTFKNLFSSEISQKVLNHYWQSLLNNRIAGQQSDGDEFIGYLARKKFQNPKLKLTHAVSYWSTKLLLDDINIRELKPVIYDLFSKRAWYAFNAKLKKHKDTPKQSDVLNTITNTLKSFKTITNI